MRVWIIDAAALQSREQLHEWAAAALPLPAYYGNNLDALYDCLSSLDTDICIDIQNAGDLPHRFGRWGENVLRLLARAWVANVHLTLLIDDQHLSSLINGQ